MIYINGRFLMMPVTGVQRYARELIKTMDCLLSKGKIAGKEIDIICLVPPDCNEDPGWSKIQIRKTGHLKGNLWEQVDLPWQARGQLLFSPANIGPFFHDNQVVTIHDASVFAFPQAYSFSFRLKYRITIKRLGKIARRIITVSEFSKRELIHYCQMRPEIFEVIPLGSEHFACITPDGSILSRSALLGKKYFLGVSSQSPHKNLHNLIEAFRKLKRDDVELVLVGGKFGRVFQSSKLNLPDHTVHLGYINDAELNALYQHAVGYVFPSFYEGFGLPVLEAMAAGCPVICSNAASLPEVGGEAVLYCNPNSPENIAKQMKFLLENDALRKSLSIKGEQQAQKFSWETTAKRTWETLVSLDPIP